MNSVKAVGSQEAAILNRLVRPDKELPKAAARALLRLDFDDSDRARMHELALKNQADELTAQEEGELLGYVKVGLFIDLIHARARRSLKNRPRGA